MSAALDITGLLREEVRAHLAALGEPPYRGDQAFEWIHRHGVPDVEAMANLPRALRRRLAEAAPVRRPEVARREASRDGTAKLLLKMPADGALVESVVIPEEEGHRTLCVSTQVGCTLRCTFCMTGRSGFTRNLGAGEIVSQLWAASQGEPLPGGRAPLPIAKGARPVTHIVLMGMGEPLANPDEVLRALKIWTDPRGQAFPPSHITLSTAGYRPEALRPILEAVRVNVAISLHAASDDLRDALLPHNKKFPIGRLLAAVTEIMPLVRDRVTFEYVLIAGVNDDPAQARTLADLLSSFPAKVNLIPWNPFPIPPADRATDPAGAYRRPSADAVDRFRAALLDAGIDAYVRRPRGDDIAAACGQLRVQELAAGPSCAQ